MCTLSLEISKLKNCNLLLKIFSSGCPKEYSREIHYGGAPGPRGGSDVADIEACARNCTEKRNDESSADCCSFEEKDEDGALICSSSMGMRND